MSEDKDVAVAETLDASSERGSTVASERSPPVRAGRHSIVPVGTGVGRYEIAERIGAGGMGTVYRAHDPKLARDVAVKLVASSDAEAAQQYLEREAQAMAKLSHPNVAIVHDIGTWNGQLFIAMELCAGGSLAKWLAEPRPWRDVVRRLVDAGRGLSAAHRIGLVHRDFKPDNVLIAADGTIKVSDFGLVRSSTGVPSTESNPDVIEGTPAYMAPEQLEGKDVDARADQFAFAVSLWEGVFGGRPFQPEVGTRDMIEGMLRAIRARRLMRATTSRAPKRLLEILTRALSPDPADRWPSLDALLDALERVATPSRARWVAAGAGAALLAVGVTAAIMYVRRPSPDVPHAIQAVERGLGRVYEAAGDLALASKRGDFGVPGNQDFMVAVTAFDAAHAATGDREIRPKLAYALRQTDRCTQAVMQLDTYLREGGETTIDALGEVTFVYGGRDRQPRKVDMTYLMEMKRECEDIARLPQSPEDLQSLAMQMWRSGSTDEAVRLLEHAYVIAHDPSYVLQIADIYRSSGECAAARKHYERYISLAKDVPQAWLDKVRGFADLCTPADPPAR